MELKVKQENFDKELEEKESKIEELVKDNEMELAKGLAA